MANENNGNNRLPLQRMRYLVGYNVLLSLFLGFLLYQTLVEAESFQTKQSEKTPLQVETSVTVAPTLKGDSVKTTVTTDTIPHPIEPAQNSNKGTTGMISYVLLAILLAGGLGGALCNLRGIFQFARDNSFFPTYLEIPFYLRPISGMICGLFTFFVGSFFAGALSKGEADGWQTFQGMFPFIGIAFLAGFASQEFMERLKETAKTLFSTASIPTEPSAEPDSTAPSDDYELDDSALRGPKKRSGTLPDAVAKAPIQEPRRRRDD